MAQWTEPDDKYGLVMEEKRKAILNHLIGIHRHRGHIHYKKCTHGHTQQLTMDKRKHTLFQLMSLQSKTDP